MLEPFPKNPGRGSGRVGVKAIKFCVQYVWQKYLTVFMIISGTIKKCRENYGAWLRPAEIFLDNCPN
jgi:hypothetical protein